MFIPHYALPYAKDGTLEKKLDEISGKGIALLPQWHGRFFICALGGARFPRCQLAVFRNAAGNIKMDRRRRLCDIMRS